MLGTRSPPELTDCGLTGAPGASPPDEVPQGVGCWPGGDLSPETHRYVLSRVHSDTYELRRPAGKCTYVRGRSGELTVLYLRQITKEKPRLCVPDSVLRGRPADAPAVVNWLSLDASRPLAARERPAVSPGSLASHPPHFYLRLSCVRRLSSLTATVAAQASPTPPDTSQ